MPIVSEKPSGTTESRGYPLHDDDDEEATVISVGEPDPDEGRGTTVQGIILCGGLGTRATHLPEGLPKSLYEVQGRPFIEWQLDQLIETGIVSDVILAVGHGHAQIREQIGTIYSGVPIKYSVEPSQYGTGGALSLAMEDLHAPWVIVMNGDTILPLFDLNKVLAFHAEKKAAATIVVTDVLGKHEYDNVDFVREDFEPGLVLPNQVLGFSRLQQYTDTPSPWVNAGVYVLDSCHQPLVKGLPWSLERDTFPQWIGSRFYAYPVRNIPLVDIGDPERAAFAQNVFYRA